jgi:hypothetical protein
VGILGRYFPFKEKNFPIQRVLFSSVNKVIITLIWSCGREEKDETHFFIVCSWYCCPCLWAFSYKANWMDKCLWKRALDLMLHQPQNFTPSLHFALQSTIQKILETFFYSPSPQRAGRKMVGKGSLWTISCPHSVGKDKGRCTAVPSVSSHSAGPEQTAAPWQRRVLPLTHEADGLMGEERVTEPGLSPDWGQGRQMMKFKITNDLNSLKTMQKVHSWLPGLQISPPCEAALK